MRKFSSQNPVCRGLGFSYVEVLLTVTITAMIMLALMGLVNTATETSDDVRARNGLTQQARFALARMVRMVSHSRRLLLPLNDNSATNWPEHIREQTVPASAPIGDSTLATAVLAITLPRDIDLDQDGVPDADNDGDGRFDEDPGADNNLDGAPGIYLIDDNGDGIADDSTDADPTSDNDEDDVATEETENGLDDDGDGSIDEDLASDTNRDDVSGIVGVDDNGNGQIDEGNKNDDDEDGLNGEDWYDSVVYFLAGGNLKERLPVPWDANGDTYVNGADFSETVIAANVTRFRVERVASGNNVEMVDVTVELTDPDSGESVSLQTRVRLGGSL